MDIGNRLLHRAYVLVEAEIPAGAAIEDLVTLAQGDVSHLEMARQYALAGDLPESDGSLEAIGFEPGLVQVARMRRAALGDLLDRAIASFG
jgi:hypothetical protein